VEKCNSREQFPQYHTERVHINGRRPHICVGIEQLWRQIRQPRTSYSVEQGCIGQYRSAVQLFGVHAAALRVDSPEKLASFTAANPPAATLTNSRESSRMNS